MMENFVAECVPETDSARKFQSFSLGHGHDIDPFLSIPNQRFFEVVLWFRSLGSFVHK